MKYKVQYFCELLLQKVITLIRKHLTVDLRRDCNKGDEDGCLFFALIYIPMIYM